MFPNHQNQRPKKKPPPTLPKPKINYDQQTANIAFASTEGSEV